MKKVILVSVLLAMILLIVLGTFPGCGEKDQTGSKPATVTGEDVKKDVMEAYDTTRAYTQEQMQEFIKQAETRLDEYRDKIDQLQAMAENLGEDGKAKAQEHLTFLRQKRDEASDKLKDLRSSSGNAWDQIKSGIDAALEDLGNAYKKAVAELSAP